MSVEDKKIWTQRFFRLLAVIPPLIGSAFMNDLGKVTDFTGIFGFSIAFIVPALLAYYSQLKCTSRGLSISTPYLTYEGFLTGTIAQIASICLGLFLTIFVLVGLLI